MSMPQCPGDAKAGRQPRLHGRLSRQRVAEPLQEAQVAVLARLGPQGSHQRGDQQPRDATGEAALGDPVVIALGEAVAKAGMGHRIHQPGQQLAAVAHDVGIVHGDHRLGPPGQYRSQAVPDVAAFAAAARREPLSGQTLLDAKDGVAVVPYDVSPLGKGLDQASGVAEVGLVGLVETYHDPGQPVSRCQFAKHRVERVRADLRGEAGDDQRHRPLRGPRSQVPFEVRHAAVKEVVQSGHPSGLAEVGHAEQCRTRAPPSHAPGFNLRNWFGLEYDSCARGCSYSAGWSLLTRARVRRLPPTAATAPRRCGGPPSR